MTVMQCWTVRPVALATSTSVDQEVQMNIYTSDAITAGQAAADSLNEQLQDAQMMAARGGR